MATLHRHKKIRASGSLYGFSLLSSIITVGILGTIGMGLPALVANNQDLRTSSLHGGQAYFTTRASFEYGLRQIYVDGDPDILPARDFAGEAFTIDRSDSKIKVVGSKGNASNAFSVTDPFPPNEAKCLFVDFSGAISPGDFHDLEDIYVAHAPSTPLRCVDPVTIVSMTISWTPLTGQKIDEIEFDDLDVYDDHPGQGSGSTFIFPTPYTFTNTTDEELEIEWNGHLNPATIVTISFNMQDGSAKTIVVDNSL